MGKKLRVLATLLMAVMMMASVSVFAATNSPAQKAVTPAPACTSKTVNVKIGKKSKVYKKDATKTIVLKRNKKAAKHFTIKVVKGASVKSSSKNITVKKLSATSYKVTVKKNKKVSGTVTVKKSGYSTVKIAIKQK